LCHVNKVGNKMSIRNKKAKPGTMAKNKKNAIYAMLGVTGFAAVVLVTFSALSSDSVSVTADEAKEVLREENIEVLASMPEEQRHKKLKAYAKALAEEHMKNRQEGENPPEPPKDGKRPEPPFRQTMSKLSDDDRKAFRQGMREAFHERMKARVDAFFAATAEEQEKMLDEDIARMKERRRPPEAKTSSDAKDSGKEGDKGKGPDGPRRRPSREAMENHMRERLKDQTPAERAKMQEYFRRLIERRNSSKS